jgi:hypothetical protein
VEKRRRQMTRKKVMKPSEILQAMADEYKNKLGALQSEYIIRHYRNSCGMVGVFEQMTEIRNCELLVGDAKMVNCPYCKPKGRKKPK